jgi:hypothetical protein
VGPNYLVMELVEGETLAARIKEGALPIGEVLRYGAQIERCREYLSFWGTARASR